MTQQDRTTLKSFFHEGALPSAEHYRDLIDSAVNQVEDGFDKTPVNGLKLTSVGDNARLMSLYEGLGEDVPTWTLDHGAGISKGSLHFMPVHPSAGATIPATDAKPGQTTNEDLTPPTDLPTGMTLTSMGYVGINAPEPAFMLDVAGPMRMSGRSGMASPGIASAAADGKWKPITGAMTGCQILEVTAGIGEKAGNGRYSLVHAIAMNAFHPRNPVLNWLFRRRHIKAQTAVYDSYADRLRLKWEATDKPHHYRLMIKANAKFGNRRIRYQITRLWFDPRMLDAAPRPEDKVET